LCVKYVLATNKRYNLVRHPVSVCIFSDCMPPILDLYVLLTKEKVVLSSQIRDIAFSHGRVGNLATHDDHLRIANDIAGGPPSTPVVRNGCWRRGIYLYLLVHITCRRGLMGDLLGSIETTAMSGYRSRQMPLRFLQCHPRHSLIRLELISNLRFFRVTRTSYRKFDLLPRLHLRRIRV
jgi:hypothetical protein